MQKRPSWRKRAAAEEDRQTILALAKEQMDSVLLRAWGEPVNASDLFDIDGLQLYVVEGIKGKMLGFYGVLPRGDALHVHTLVLAKAAQGKGLGTDIMAAIEREAETTGYQALELCVQTTNPRALKLYERLGFVRQGYVFVSTLLLRKELT